MNQMVMPLNTFLVRDSNRAVGRRRALHQRFSLGRNASAAIAFALLFWTNTALAQSLFDDAPRPIVAPTQAQEGSRASSPLATDIHAQAKSTPVSPSPDSSSLGSSTK